MLMLLVLLVLLVLLLLLHVPGHMLVVLMQLHLHPPVHFSQAVAEHSVRHGAGQQGKSP